MSSFVGIDGAAEGRGVPVSTDASWVPQQQCAHDQRNPRQQRCSHRARRRAELYQSAHNANCKIVASARVGPPQQRRFAAVETTGRRRCRQARVDRFGSGVKGQTGGGCCVIRGRLQGSMATAWCGAGVGIGSKEVEVVLLNRGAHAMFQADLPADTREATLFSNWLPGLWELLTATKQAVDPVESPQRGARSRRTRRPGAGRRAPAHP